MLYKIKYSCSEKSDGWKKWFWTGNHYKYGFNISDDRYIQKIYWTITFWFRTNLNMLYKIKYSPATFKSPKLNIYENLTFPYAFIKESFVQYKKDKYYIIAGRRGKEISL